MPLLAARQRAPLKLHPAGPSRHLYSNQLAKVGRRQQASWVAWVAAHCRLPRRCGYAPAPLLAAAAWPCAGAGAAPCLAAAAVPRQQAPLEEQEQQGGNER